MSPVGKPSDFVSIQLTAAGAKGAPVGFANGHFNYEFAAGQPVRVLTSEWARVLSRETIGGGPLFELAPEAPAPKPVPAPAAPQASQKGN